MAGSGGTSHVFSHVVAILDPSVKGTVGEDLEDLLNVVEDRTGVGINFSKRRFTIRGSEQQVQDAQSLIKDALAMVSQQQHQEEGDIIFTEVSAFLDPAIKDTMKAGLEDLLTLVEEEQHVKIVYSRGQYQIKGNLQQILDADTIIKKKFLSKPTFHQQASLQKQAAPGKRSASSIPAHAPYPTEILAPKYQQLVQQINEDRTPSATSPRHQSPISPFQPNKDFQQQQHERHQTEMKPMYEVQRTTTFSQSSQGQRTTTFSPSSGLEQDQMLPTDDSWESAPHGFGDHTSSEFSLSGQEDGFYGAPIERSTLEASEPLEQSVKDLKLNPEEGAALDFRLQQVEHSSGQRSHAKGHEDIFKTSVRVAVGNNEIKPISERVTKKCPEDLLENEPNSLQLGMDRVQEELVTTMDTEDSYRKTSFWLFAEDADDKQSNPGKDGLKPKTFSQDVREKTSLAATGYDLDIRRRTELYRPGERGQDTPQFTADIKDELKEPAARGTEVHFHKETSSSPRPADSRENKAAQGYFEDTGEATSPPQVLPREELYPDTEMWNYILKVHSKEIRDIRKNYDVSITSSGEDGPITTVILQANERSSDAEMAAEKLKMLLHETNLFMYIEIFNAPEGLSEQDIKEALEEVQDVFRNIVVKVGSTPGKLKFIGEEKVVKQAKVELFRIFRKCYTPAEGGSAKRYHNSLVGSMHQNAANAWGPSSCVSEDTAPFDSVDVNGLELPPFDESEEDKEKLEIPALSTLKPEQDSKVVPPKTQELSFPSKAEKKRDFGSEKVQAVESTEAEDSAKEGDDFGALQVNQQANEEKEILISQLLEAGGSENLKLVEELLEQDDRTTGKRGTPHRAILPGTRHVKDSHKAMEGILAPTGGGLLDHIGNIQAITGGDDMKLMGLGLEQLQHADKMMDALMGMRSCLSPDDPLVARLDGFAKLRKDADKFIPVGAHMKPDPSIISHIGSILPAGEAPDRGRGTVEEYYHYEDGRKVLDGKTLEFRRHKERLEELLGGTPEKQEERMDLMLQQWEMYNKMIEEYSGMMKHFAPDHPFKAWIDGMMKLRDGCVQACPELGLRAAPREEKLPELKDWLESSSSDGSVPSSIKDPRGKKVVDESYRSAEGHSVAFEEKVYDSEDPKEKVHDSKGAKEKEYDSEGLKEKLYGSVDAKGKVYDSEGPEEKMYGTGDPKEKDLSPE